jgi:hypothetical protein
MQSVACFVEKQLDLLENQLMCQFKQDFIKMAHCNVAVIEIWKETRWEMNSSYYIVTPVDLLFWGYAKNKMYIPLVQTDIEETETGLVALMKIRST